jgi:hypothetical protein
MVTGDPNIDAMPVNNLIVVPELSASTTPEGACKPSHVTWIPPQHPPTSAPMLSMALRVALVSWEFSQLVIQHLSSESAERKNALCVWLFDGGGVIMPFTEPPENLII